MVRRVATDEVEAMAACLARAQEDLVAAAAAVAASGGVAVVEVGAHAVADAVSDLLRAWAGTLEGADAEAAGLRRALALAAAAYGDCESDVVAALGPA